jgi:hypothetical protein
VTDVLVVLKGVAANGSSGTYDAGDLKDEVGIQVETTGAPTFSVQVAGSLDGVSFFSVGSPVTLVTAETTVTGILARYFKATLSSLSGGTLTCKLALGKS